ncbi:uncharacterized protein [Venturia canescens]|uniref:uncharacterized protein isoform X2 n=1 Tax=Venturia canescens TaxID=32260 RepID=UPI001C9CBEA1|nr:uncharacterized protein LOC122405717 isoform X2 [Venturia canescens]
MPRKSSGLPPPKDGKTCCFCGLADVNELDYGKIHEYSGIITHYYCLLFSSNMQQQGSDDEGILGFLPDDIHKEIKRGKRLVCSYCKKNGATLGCCNTKCKKIFHFPCGLKNGSLHQFFGEFRSYCIHHRPKQVIEDRIWKELSQCEKRICYICYDEVNPRDHLGTIWAPCCKKNAWFHRVCVQQLAMSAGYFFKCPLCNNKAEFQKAMLDHGIFIPSQDASWELVPNAFHELLYRHNRCDAVKCVCPKGREYTGTNAKWELTLCRTCGSQGIHSACGNLRWGNPIWECNECTSILNKSGTNTETFSHSSNSRRSQVENDISDDESSSDSEISVGGGPETFTDTCDSHVEPQSSSFVPEVISIKEKSPEKQRLFDTGSKDSLTSPRSITENRETQAVRENNDELAPLTKKPKIEVARKADKDDSDDDVIIVSGPSCRESYRPLSKPWPLGNNRAASGTKENTKLVEIQSKSNTIFEEVLNVGKKVWTSLTGSSTSSQVRFPVSKVGKSVPIEIDLSDSETGSTTNSCTVVNSKTSTYPTTSSPTVIKSKTWMVPTMSSPTDVNPKTSTNPTTSSSTVVNPKTSTNSTTVFPELNIQISNVTSLAPEAFASVPESNNQSTDSKKVEHVPSAEKPKNPAGQQIYQRLEIIRLEAQPAANNLPKPVIYSLTIPGTNTAVPLIITTAETSQPAPPSTNNSPVQSPLSRLAGPKSRKAAIWAAAVSNTSTIQDNSTSAGEVPKLVATVIRTDDPVVTSTKATPGTLQNNESSTVLPPVQNDKGPISVAPQPAPIFEQQSKVLIQNKDGSMVIITPKSSSQTTRSHGQPPFLLPKRSVPNSSNEESAVLSPIVSNSSQVQSNQRSIVAAPELTTSTISNNDRSNIATVTVVCNNNQTVVTPNSTNSTIQSNRGWPLLAPKQTPPLIQSDETSTSVIEVPSESSTPKLSYSLPLEAVVNDEILKSRAGKKFSTKSNVPCNKASSKKTEGSSNVQINQNSTTAEDAAPTTEVSTTSIKTSTPNRLITSSKVCLFTPKPPPSPPSNSPSINTNSSAAVKVPTFLIDNTSEIQNGSSAGISVGNNLNKSPSCNEIRRSFETPPNKSNNEDLQPTGSRTNPKPLTIPISPHSKISYTEDRESLDSSENCTGDAGTDPAVPSKSDVAINIKSNETIGPDIRRNIRCTRDKNDVSKKSGADNEFRNDSQFDAEKNETTQRSIASERRDSPDRIGLINKMIRLRDLKFKVCGSNIVKMEIYKTYCVNMKIDNGKKRKLSSCKNDKVSKMNSADLLFKGTENCSLPHGSDYLRNVDDRKRFSGSLMSSCAFSSDENSEKAMISQSSNSSQSNTTLKVSEVLPIDSKHGNINSRGQDELKENLDPIPPSTNISRTISPIERKSKTRLRNSGVTTMQLLNEQGTQDKVIDKKTESSPRKKANDDQSLGTSKILYNEWKESACSVARNLVVANDAEVNGFHCGNTTKTCKTRMTCATENEEISERVESSPKRAKYEKFEAFKEGTLPINNTRIENPPFSHLVTAEKVQSRRSSRVKNVSKNEKLHSNAPKNGKRSSRISKSGSDNSVCCKVSIDLAKIRSVLANTSEFVGKFENNVFQKFQRKNERSKFTWGFLFKTFRSHDNLTIEDNCSSSVQQISKISIRRWKSDGNLFSDFKSENTFREWSRISDDENVWRRGHKRKTRNFEKHDCVR